MDRVATVVTINGQQFRRRLECANCAEIDTCFRMVMMLEIQLWRLDFANGSEEIIDAMGQQLRLRGARSFCGRNEELKKHLQ